MVRKNLINIATLLNRYNIYTALIVLADKQHTPFTDTQPVGSRQKGQYSIYEVP